MQIIHSKQALTPEGWRSDVQITINAAGRISAVSRQDGQPTHRTDLLLPAPVNLHSHAFQRAMAGLTEARGSEPKDSFWTWRRLMYRFLDQLTPDEIEAIAALVFMEMQEAGFGAVAEFHYLHHDIDGLPYADMGELSGRIVAAAGTSGIGLTLLPVHYQYGGCDLRPLAGGQQRFGNDLDRFAQVHAAATRHLSQGSADGQIGVAPHSLRAVDPGALSELLALHPSGPFHMHLAEQVAEVDEVTSCLGARPVTWLLDRHAVDDRWCLIHCTQMTDGETRALAETGAVAGLCPLTESNLGDGIFNGTAYLGHGGAFGIGSDSNIQISLFEEMKTLEYSQRLRDRSRAALATNARSTGRVLFEGAAKGGAKAGGRHSGLIAEGAWADLIGIDTDNHWLCNRSGDALLDSLIFGGGGQACLRDVWSAGRHMVRQGRHIERDTIVARYMTTLRRLETHL
ncbi:MAG: formimidoylglutamate deiminase [Sulfitobacter sp.]|nr:formimidoylglutamate deiminase [Sulfitobacter sp.]